MFCIHKKRILGATTIQILLHAWIVYAAPPTLPVSNNATKVTSTDVPMDSHQGTLKCVKFPTSWMCPLEDTSLGFIPLEIIFEPMQVIIKCTQDISCGQLPSLDGELTTVQALEVHSCGAVSPRCVLRSGAVKPASLNYLTLDRAAFDGIDELVGLQILTFNEYGKTNKDPWVVPLKSLTNMSVLRKLCVHNGFAVLPADGFSEQIPLKHLELATLGMTELPQQPFTGLNRLTTLGLWNNMFADFEPDVFKGLHSLKTLNLSGNRLKTIPQMTFAYIPSITELIIKSNYISHISAGDFEGLHNLTTLDLSDNRVSLAILEGSFGELTSLVTLKIVGSQVMSLISIGAPALRTLDLSSNHLRTLQGDNIFPRTLTTLLLDDNKLEELFKKQRNLESLETLSASRNRLHFIDRAAMIPMRHSLRALRLNHNRLSFRYNLHLYSPFEDLQNLSDLDLSHNLITDIFNDWLYTLLNLKTLNLSHNHIQILVEQATHFLASNLLTVDLRYNNISTVLAADGDSIKGSQPSSKLNPRPATLLLAHNPLHCDCHLRTLLRLPQNSFAPTFTLQAAAAWLRLDDAACAEPTSLRGVPLASLSTHDLTCEIPACPSDCKCRVRPDTAAVELACSSWPLAAAPPTLPAPNYSYVLRLETRGAAEAALADLGALPPHTRVLNCSGLALVALPAVHTAPHPELGSLDLRDNALSAPPWPALAEHGPHVLLAGNPLRCDCAHGHALQQLAAHGARTDYAVLRCVGGGLVSAAGSPAALCLAWHATLAGGVLGTLALLLAVAALLLWRYSLELRVWLAARGLLARWIDAEEMQCEYDAFVSYSHLDEKFVVEELVPALEGARRPRALCLHYRDWHAGESIAANVARSVQRSRRTLVLLSRNFLASEWGRLEFRVAVAAALRSARGVLVLLLEDVAGDARLDGELAAYIATHTYLELKDPNFWPRLQRALPATALRLRELRLNSDSAEPNQPID